MKPTLVPVSKCLVALGHSRSGTETRKRHIKELGIKILGRVNYAKGQMDMMAREQMDQLVAAHKARPDPVTIYPLGAVREEMNDRFKTAFDHISNLRDRIQHLEAELGVTNPVAV